tara:strand:- start:1409 stop:1960 length:552 start_codon:yes stop_codon:yes gene_type:complete
MRTLIFTILAVFTSPVMVAPTSPIDELIFIEEEVKSEPIKDYYLFLNDLGHRESGNRYHVVNKYGYMGKYQFGKSTLKTLKIKVTKEAFLNSPDLQEYAMLKLLCYNKNKLQKYIDKYEGQVVNDILVTESGLLAAAHLGGAGSVRKWFRTGKIRKDGNGVKITSYMKQFSGYDLDLNNKNII